jgi:hypothetical protein
MILIDFCENDYMVLQQVLSSQSYAPTLCNHHTLNRLQLLLEHYQLSLRSIRSNKGSNPTIAAGHAPER